MRCVLDSPTLRLSKAVPTVGIEILIWHLEWEKVQSLCYFGAQINPPVAIRNLETFTQSHHQNLHRV